MPKLVGSFVFVNKLISQNCPQTKNIRPWNLKQMNNQTVRELRYLTKDQGLCG